jgi:hypothetical protein
MNGEVHAPASVWRRFSAVKLLVTLAALFVFLPFIEPLTSGVLLESLLFTFVLIAGVIAIGGRGRTLIIALALVVPALAARWLHELRPDLVPPEIFLIGSILFIIFVIANLLHFIASASSVTTNVLCAALSAYLLLALGWTFAYWLVVEFDSAAFAFNASVKGGMSIKGFDGLYFSIVTLSTLGYGDISPVSKAARMLASMEALTGPLYLAVLIARLVAMHSPKSS